VNLAGVCVKLERATATVQWFVTMDIIMVVGWVIIATNLMEIALQFAMNHATMGMDRLIATMEWMTMAVGWEITVLQNAMTPQQCNFPWWISLNITR